MKIIATRNGYKLCLNAKELTLLLIHHFFKNLFAKKSLMNEEYNSQVVSNYIRQLAKETVDSKEYEYFMAILDLYQMFSKDCFFCFYLKNSYNPKKDLIKTLDDIDKYKNDPPDVIVRYKNKDYEFELKRYRGKLTFKSLYEFIKKKIVLHYSGKTNFLIVLQQRPGMKIKLDLFKKIHEKLKIEKKNPGYIGITFNNNNKEVITVRVLPKLEKYSRSYIQESNAFIELLNS